MRALLALVGAIVTFIAAQPARAADYFDGKTIRLVVGYDATGGYAVYARVLAPFLTRYIPGKPNVVVQYMPGAGGLTLANNLAHVADRDGLTIGLLPRTIPFQPLLGNPGAKYKAEDFTWLGTSSSYQNDAYCIIVRSDSPYRTLADLQKPGPAVPFGSEGGGGTNTDMLLIAKDVFALNIQLIRGYKGTGDIAMAMSRKEVVGRTIGMSSLMMSTPDLVRDGKIRFIVQFNRKRWARLADVPTAHELATTDDQRALLDLAETPLLLARPYAAPPHIPAEATAILRKAFMDAHRDPEYLALNAKTNSDVSPLDGDEVQAIVSHLARTPQALVRRYKTALEIK